jgi:hypothetical protein
LADSRRLIDGLRRGYIWRTGSYARSVTWVARARQNSGLTGLCCWGKLPTSPSAVIQRSHLPAMWGAIPRTPRLLPPSLPSAFCLARYGVTPSRSPENWRTAHRQATGPLPGKKGLYRFSRHHPGRRAVFAGAGPALSLVAEGRHTALGDGLRRAADRCCSCLGGPMMPGQDQVPGSICIR